VGDVVLTKHEQILQYIENLDVGEKISVRQIAKIMDVSEGTAYRAVKEAEARGIVDTIERVGTVRIENQKKKQIERLTFAEVVNIVDGTVLGGHTGLQKTLHKFVIGAMQLEEISKYIDRNSLMIVGNRVKVHRLSLEHGAAILVTGGFGVSDDVKELADQLELPIISSSYDTFTVATLINQAIYDRFIKKDILLVEDILPNHHPVSLHIDDKVSDWYRLLEKTGHSRFPVVDSNFRVVGMITPRDVSGEAMDTPIESLMTKHPRTVTLHTSVASAASLMVWEGVELLPIVDRQKLVGVISRQDVIKGLQFSQKQPHMTESIEDHVLKGVREEKVDERTLALYCQMTPQMMNRIGQVSTSVLMTLIETAGLKALRKMKNVEMVSDHVTISYMKPVQLETEVKVVARVLDLGRAYGKVEVEWFNQKESVGKAYLAAIPTGRS
jgi:uncharacterized protein (TIGR00369 family)